MTKEQIKRFRKMQSDSLKGKYGWKSAVQTATIIMEAEKKRKEKEHVA